MCIHDIHVSECGEYTYRYVIMYNMQVSDVSYASSY